MHRFPLCTEPKGLSGSPTSPYVYFTATWATAESATFGGLFTSSGSVVETICDNELACFYSQHIYSLGNSINNLVWFGPNSLTEKTYVNKLYAPGTTPGSPVLLQT